VVEDALRLRVRPEFLGAVAFAEVYECQVLEVLDGELEDSSIKLTVPPSDRELGTLLAGQNEVELAFAKDKENEPYALVPISGFVDGNRTSWRIVDAHGAT
jgi:hypothetical protein